MIRGGTKRLHGKILVAFVLLAAVAGGQTQEQGRAVLRAQQFRDNPALLAHAPQSVLLDQEPRLFEEPTIRYELEEGTHDFCLTGKRTGVAAIVREEFSGEKVLEIPSYERCARVALPGGIYRLHFARSIKHEQDGNLSARVQVDPPDPPLTDSGGQPVPGFWAVQPDPAGDQQHRLGRLRAYPFSDLLKDSYLYAPVTADYTSRQIDDFSLFHLARAPAPAILGVPTVGKEPTWTIGDGGGMGRAGLFLLNDAAGCGYIKCDLEYYDSVSTKIIDLGNQKFQIGAVWGAYGLYGTPYSSSQYGFTYGQKSSPNSVLQLLFRFFPDGAQIGGLNPGEAALFQTCSYAGKAAIFPPGNTDLGALDSSIVTINNSAKSIRLGNNTAVLWRSAAGQFAAIAADTTCLEAGAATPGGNDFEVLALDTLLADPSQAAVLDKSCIHCKLQNANLANLDLEGWDLSGADLSDATLTHVNLRNAKLNGAVLNGLKLSCSDFSGADPSHTVDLTAVDFRNVQWVPGSDCRTSFRYTLLSVAKLPPALWKFVDLSYATFTDSNGQQLSSEAQPLDLSEAKLTGVSLQGAILDYAIGLGGADGLAGADLTQAVLSHASLRHVNLRNATLQGAKLNNANLDGANLSGANLTKPASGNPVAANLQGAFLRNVNLSQAMLQSADFTNASFYSTVAAGSCGGGSGFTNGCASASHATMDLTNFTSAYLFGVDFTSAKVVGVNFSNSFLTGADFAGAMLSADPSGVNNDFTAAFLQGANLKDVVLPNGTSLENAFVDFAASNTIDLLLSGEHTTFTGYWNTPGQPVCAEMGYGQPTAVPQTNENVTCPNGSSYPGGCGVPTPAGGPPNPNWKSQANITPPATYQNDSTYTPAAKPSTWCQADQNWNFVTAPRTERGTPRNPPSLPHQGERE
jgi:uncharacterized protein YjbI with pentapeptide repeats